MKLELNKLNALLYGQTLRYLIEIANFGKTINDFSTHGKSKESVITHLRNLLLNEPLREAYCQKLYATPESKKLYHTLLWRNKIVKIEDVERLYGIDMTSHFYKNGEHLQGNLSFISVVRNWRINGLLIDENIRPILKLFTPLPDDFMISPIAHPLETKYRYTNEANILPVITTIQEMLEVDLIGMGGNGEKPLAKTLTTLNTTTQNSEFFIQKDLNSLSMDIIVRSLYFFREYRHTFEATPHKTLGKLIGLQMKDRLSFFISRIFLSHMKKIRYNFAHMSQKPMWSILADIIANMPKNDWVGMESIINYSLYRDYRCDLESPYTTSQYYFVESNDKELYADDEHYNEIFFVPLHKALFFYLGAFGLAELKYDDPVSPHSIRAMGKPYISPWDGLKYVKLTPLGQYVFGYNPKYTPPIHEAKLTTVKFDEYKPIITLEKEDTIMLAKIDPYVEKYDTNRYILSFAKIFKDCRSKKMLINKIDAFASFFSVPLPPHFNWYFDDIKAKANLLKPNTTQIVIELKPDPKLLQLFASDKKIQELIIKASGYRIVVEKTNMAKLTKIIKENGFFVEF